MPVQTACSQWHALSRHETGGQFSVETENRVAALSPWLFSLAAIVFIRFFVLSPLDPKISADTWAPIRTCSGANPTCFHHVHEGRSPREGLFRWINDTSYKR